LEQLEKDPAHQQRTRDLKRWQERAKREYQKNAAPVLADLRRAGFWVDAVGDLHRPPVHNYEAAIPILLSWLPRINDRWVKEDIVRTMTVKWARPAAAAPLILEYERADSLGLEPRHAHGLKWAIGNALEVVADDSVFDDVARLAQDQRHGKSREMVVAALGNMKDPRATDVLVALLDDDQVAGHALWGLRKLGAVSARSSVERFLDHPKTWWRNEAKKALKKFDRIEERARAREATQGRPASRA
jgi:hypothetical protein